MANEITRKIVDFFKDGASLHGKGLVLGGAALAVFAGVTMASAFGPTTSEIPRLAPEVAASMIAEVQQRLDNEVPGAGILVLNLSKDTKEQIAAFAERGEGPECLVYAATIDGHELMMGVNTGDMSPSDYSRWMIYSDVAQCLGADGVEHAKMFGALMTFQDTKSKDFAPIMAAWADLNELRGSYTISEFWSDTAWKVAGALRSPGFRDSLATNDLTDVFEIAQKGWDFGDQTMKANYAIAFREALRSDHHYVQVQGGLIDTDSFSWLQLMQDDAAPVERFLSLWDNLHTPDGLGRDFLGPDSIDWPAAVQAHEELGLRADSTSRTIAKAFGSEIEFDYAPIVIPEQPFDPARIRGTLYQVDLAGLSVTYDAEGKGFAAADENHVPVAVGMRAPLDGLTSQFHEQGQVVVFPRRDRTEDETVSVAMR